MQTGWDKCRNILCIRLDNLGDILMTTPAIRALKEAVPGRRITLLASNAGSGIARFVPEIDEVIPFEVPWQGSASAGSQTAVLEMVEKLKGYTFDAAVIFTVYSQNPLPTAMLCYLAGIPRIAGYCRENPYGLMTDWFPDQEPLYEIKHEVTRQLELVKGLGAESNNDSFSLTVSPEATQKLIEKLRQHGVDPERPWLVLHPGVSEAKRQYPVEKFAEAARMLSQESNYQILLTGVASEKPLVQKIRQQAAKKSFDLTDELSLEELIALIKLSPLVIANNTGPVHIAAAVGTPVVVLYALTNPQHTPWKVPNVILPFDVPVTLRSQNTIITLAYERAFRQGEWNKGIERMVQPGEIVQAARTLLEGNRSLINGHGEEDHLR